MSLYKPVPFMWIDWHTWLCILTQIIKFIRAPFSLKWQPKKQQKDNPSFSYKSRILHRCVLDSLRKGIVVPVIFWRGCCEILSGGHRARVWWRLRLAVWELEWPLVGHMLRLRVGWFGGEVHAISKQTVCALLMQTHMRAVNPTDYSSWLSSVVAEVHLVNAFFSSLHCSVHLLLVLQVSWNGPVHLWSHLLIYTPQARLGKHSHREDLCMSDCVWSLGDTKWMYIV